jgi:ubiquinone/menaquinone biosynthesis C-methylase UbiE
MGKSTLLFLLLATAAWTQSAKTLNDPKRDVWQKPKEVVQALGLGKSEVIADIGAGTGYFARRFAPVAEKVYAVDIDEAVLKTAADGAPPNLEVILAAADDPKLPDNSVDTVFFCDVLHHISNRPDYLKKLSRSLRPGGRVVIIDFQKKALPVGPPPSMKLSEQEVIAQMKEAGFTKTKSFDILPYQYFLVFNK